MSKIHTHCPVVKSGQEAFVQFVSVGGERKRVEFAKDIQWIQESESRVQFIHGGEVLKEGSVYGDFYGYLTSTDVTLFSPTPGAIALKYGVHQSSTLEIVARSSVKLIPVVELSDDVDWNKTKPAAYKRQFSLIPNDWRLEIARDGEVVYPQLEEELLGSDIIWSSKNAPDRNAELRAAFAVKWAVSSLNEPVVEVVS